jgi:glycosyltransferase involved in cell wall biosynthesis
LDFFNIYEIQKYTILQKLINRLSTLLFNYRLFDKYRSIADFVFPVLNNESKAFGQKQIFWIPDFQDKKLPNFFSSDEILKRSNWQIKLSAKKSIVIFSSNDALADYKKYYPNSITINRVIPFVAINDNSSFPDFETLKLKYDLQDDYFISPNQFWAHKSHITILEAIKIIISKKKKVFIVFTGKEYDYRHPDYYNSLKKFVKDNQLDSFVSFLGFIDRKDQLALIYYSKAVIQPSLCEGWSTVIEDAKSLKKVVIASDLIVHKEQLEKNGIFFNTLNYQQLANILLEFDTSKSVSIDYSYQLQIEKFAYEFLSVINSN